MGRSPPQPTRIWEYTATGTSIQHMRLGFRMEFRIIRTCQNRSGRWPIQRSIRQQAIVVVTAEVREEQARRLVPIVGARRAAGMKRSSGRRTKEDCLLLRACAFSQDRRLSLSPSYLLSAKELLGEGYAFSPLRDQTSPFSPTNLASKAELVNTKKLASGNR